MKKIFEGEIFEECPEGWGQRLDTHRWLGEDVLRASKYRDTPFRFVVHKKYVCCEYTKNINLFTFGRLNFTIPVTFVAMPFSIDEPGFSGDINALIDDYRRRKGFFLLLNLKSVDSIGKRYPKGNTLFTCIFENKFKSFDEYLLSLRSNYRRRISIAQKRGKALIIRKIDSEEFNDELHKLYLNVLGNSKYPLETLDKGFFQTINSDIHVFYKDEKPVAFISTKRVDNTLHFLLGGMDYTVLKELDLYYNMLLHIVKLGIEQKFKKINFGQTGEISKLRIGCTFEKRYMVAVISNGFLNSILRLLKPFIEYRFPEQNNRVFKSFT